MFFFFITKLFCVRIIVGFFSFFGVPKIHFWQVTNCQTTTKKKAICLLPLAWLGLAWVWFLGLGLGLGFLLPFSLCHKLRKFLPLPWQPKKVPPQQKVPGKQQHIPPSNRHTIPTKCPPLRRSTRKRKRWEVEVEEVELYNQSIYPMCF